MPDAENPDVFQQCDALEEKVKELKSALAASKKREEELEAMISSLHSWSGVVEKTSAERAEAIQAKDAEIAGLREALEGMVNQFGYIAGGKRHTGGLSALETAFDVLGWDDPIPAPDFLLCESVNCKEQATCGTQTASGYRRLCGEHFQALSPAPGEKAGGES